MTATFSIEQLNDRNSLFHRHIDGIFPLLNIGSYTVLISLDVIFGFKIFEIFLSHLNDVIIRYQRSSKNFAMIW
jgi:hypothetical protein